jgi:hypothetical protein
VKYDGFSNAKDRLIYVITGRADDIQDRFSISYNYPINFVIIDYAKYICLVKSKFKNPVQKKRFSSLDLKIMDWW